MKGGVSIGIVVIIAAVIVGGTVFLYFPASTTTSSQSSSSSSASSSAPVTTTTPSTSTTSQATLSTLTPSTTTQATSSEPAVTGTASTSLATMTASITSVKVIMPQGIGNNQSLNFEPPTIRIVIGVNGSIIWTNNDVVPHTVTAGSVPTGAQSFDSSTMHKGDTFQVTFTVAGTYTYHCNFHPSWMKATIIVLAGR